MKMRRIEASIPGPRLPIVLKEITERLLQDDWYRVSTGDGTRMYYIVGCSDQAAELEGEADFSRMEFPVPTKPDLLSQWTVRSQLADNKPANILSGARQHLERAGVSPAAIDRFLAGEMDDLSDWKFHRGLSADERARLLSNFFQAVRLSFSNARSIALDGEEAETASIAREKICLEQLTKKYSKIVDRWEQLDRLPFDDPQIEEASMMFLYGFYRGSVVLCASAVETQLKHLVPSALAVDGPFYLIESAEAAKSIGRDLADIARGLFWFRNRVVHDNLKPSHDQAKERLGVARMLVAGLRVT